MKSRWFAWIPLLQLLIAATLVPQRLSAGDATAEALESVRAKYNLPAIAAAVVKDGKLVATNAVGVRKLGLPVLVTANDKFHIGSCTKAFTATLAAMMVAQKKIAWTNTIADIFPELTRNMAAAYAPVTLEDLLSNRSGAPDLPDAQLFGDLAPLQIPAMQKRYSFIKSTLARQPAQARGQFLYSETGYTIAGAMLERVARKPWEELIRTMIFQPLGMTTAGFGSPGVAGQIVQPWGHETVEGGKLSPSQYDNPPTCAPSGSVHCSVGDFAKFLIYHLRVARGEIPGVNFTKLYAPIPGQDYGVGWFNGKRPWAGGANVLYHAGSNTYFTAMMWVVPDANFAMVVVMNASTEASLRAADEAGGRLIGLFVSQTGK